ncbi:hypothetical protein [Aeromicrobium chenweiae]|uniref:hypothetical protein n=1 Tax=Aeromicrobium chenweiae TaxID=2079793 RepID=UPI0010928096|nr:hypothetical protein [Aeromicrobium chenweiae]TGN32706.1 hypothetical protein E4L97_08360 [Aeromicrobium chenweiae]
MTTELRILSDLGGWLPLWNEDGPTQPSDWPTLSPSVISRLVAYNDWCLAPIPKNPLKRRRERRTWALELAALASAVQAELGDKFTVDC